MCKADDNTECDSFWIVIYAEYVQLKERQTIAEITKDLTKKTKGITNFHDIFEIELWQDVTNCIFHGFAINHIFKKYFYIYYWWLTNVFLGSTR